MGQVCFFKNFFEYFGTIYLNIKNAYEYIFTKGRLRGNKLLCRTLYFVPPSRVFFSSRCPTFRVSLLSSNIIGTLSNMTGTLLKHNRDTIIT